MLIWLALLAAAAYGLWRVFGGHPRPARPPATLSRREIAFLAAAADALYPAGGAVPPSGTEAGVPSHADRYVGAVDPRTRLLMRLLFFLVEHATVFFPAPAPLGRRRFSALSHDQRVAVLEGWRASRYFPRRLVFTSLRAILTMGYFADPAVLRELGLAPRAIDSPLVEADLLYPRVGQGRETIPWTEADLTPPRVPAPLGPEGPLHPDYAEAPQ